MPPNSLTVYFISRQLLLFHSLVDIKGSCHEGSSSYQPLLDSCNQQVQMEGCSCKSADGKEGGNGFTEITLRPLDLSDIDHFMVWASDDKVTRFCSWEPYTSKEDGIDFMKNKVIPHPWFRAICLDNRPIGSISVTPKSGIDKCRGEIGYALSFKYWGKGIATQAVKLVANTIFGEFPHMERLEALVVVENVGSQRVLEKAGFQREGVLRKYFSLKGKTRDMVMFSLLSTDPKA